jgi:hypothetical protein
MRQEREWIIGEKVARLYRGRLSRVRTVARLTKTQVILNDGEKFRKDGTGYNGDFQFDYTSIEPLTSKHIAIIEKHNLLKQIKEVKWEDLPLETLRQVTNALNELEILGVKEKS